MSDIHANSAKALLPKVPTVGFCKIARGAAWNWSQLALAGALAFGVTPYVVHRLGSAS